MVITLNGEEETVKGPITLFELLAEKRLKPESVVVELNLDIIDKDKLHDIKIRERDVIEILRFVGGG
ncbi:MAG: sulfur carrier protein ThiS [Proteobacteria bacterium]|nr:sulfur carrier protein ThiS [Pseudomonadota bacterium]